MVANLQFLLLYEIHRQSQIVELRKTAGRWAGVWKVMKK